ncbi:MAG: hypothetical protein IPG39_11795 [Bacteroidetes bacterium]|nr:hypothetical protein [Bacteroidota bacterium]
MPGYLCADYQILKPSDLLNIYEVIFVEYSVGIPSIGNIGLEFISQSNRRLFTVNSGNFQIAELRVLDIYGRILKRIQHYDGEKISLKQFSSQNYIVQALIRINWYSKLLIKLK